METPTNAQPAAPVPTPAPAPAPTTPDVLPQEGDAPLTEADVPVQVDKAVFLAARLRETLAEAANLRGLVAELQKDNAALRAATAQAEIDKLDKEYNVGSGTILQARPDGTFWRIPKSALQQQPQG